MISFDDVRIYLPKYLSEDANKKLFTELSQFPDNIDSRLYLNPSKCDDNSFLQGDGIIDLPCINLPDVTVKPLKVLIISNTCDIDQSNKRLFSSSVSYCPIYDLNKYHNSLKSKFGNGNRGRINQFITDIRSQKITQMFYLPRGSGLEYEAFIFFDKICSSNVDVLPYKNIPKRRLFSLSNYGFYLLLFKLSIHFTRIRESIDRS
jgi:hypothetical protein